jgi:hypothetical protein
MISSTTATGLSSPSLDDIEWGLINYYGADENGVSDNKYFNRLKELLETARGKACP